jgi:penicillin amidase/acyl-homoserine-lactone acylase
MKKSPRGPGLGLALGVPLLILLILILQSPRQPDLSELERLGSAYDVTILRDTWGIPHVYGQSDADAAFGLAYAHAEDDFLTIQQIMLAARGELATVYGLDAAPNDYMVELLRIGDVVEAGYERDLSPDTRAVLEAYADGLSYYAALHPDELISPSAFPVTGRDMAAASVHRSPLFFGLDGTLGDLFAEERKSAISARPGQAGTEAPNPIGKSIIGSNAFAAGPHITADGSTLLAVNSHQPWEGPVTWYEAHVHSEAGWDMAGALFPGAPVIIQGHNRDLGWAFTVNHPDLTDVYVLEIHPDDPYLYRYDHEWLRLESRQAPIDVRILGNLVINVEREVLWSIYGPTVRAEHGTYSVRYAGMGRLDIFEQLYRMNKASSFDEWQAAMSAAGLPMFNVVYADAAGNIYYLYNSLLPERQPGWDWHLYLPGDTSDTYWDSTLAFELLPQVLNPGSGFVQNANSSPYQTTIGPGNPQLLPESFGVETEMSNRALRLLELLGSDQDLSLDEFIAIKWDLTYSEQSDIPAIIDALVQTGSQDPDQQAGIVLLENWDRRADQDSQAASIMILTLHFLNEIFGPLRPSGLVNTEPPIDVVWESYVQAIDLLIEQFGRVDVAWGEVNRIRRGDLDIGLGGGPDLVHAVYGQLQDDGRFRGIAGDGVIYIVQWLPNGEVQAYSLHQFGSATLDEQSVHYADQAPLFASRVLRATWYEEADIRANLEIAYRPGEE